MAPLYGIFTVIAPGGRPFHRRARKGLDSKVSPNHRDSLLSALSVFSAVEIPEGLSGSSAPCKTVIENIRGSMIG